MAYQKKKDGAYRDPSTGKFYAMQGGCRKTYWSKQMLDDMRRLFPVRFNSELAGFLGVSQSTIIRKARELGLEKDPEWLAAMRNERLRLANSSIRRNGNPGKFKKGRHANPGTEFQKGHKLTREQQERRTKSIHWWYLTHPDAARKRALKGWETRRRKLSA